MGIVFSAMKSFLGTRFLCLCIISAFLLGDGKSIQEKDGTTAYSERMPARSQITMQCIRFCEKEPNISKPKHCDCNNPWREIGYIGLFGGLGRKTDTEDRAIPVAAVLGALGPVANMISSGGGDGSHSTWEMKDGSGVRIDANNCWQDGGGACPNGNCMDNKGPKGIMIKETTVSCKWFCGWRAHCKTQICCPQVRSMEFRSVNSSNEEEKSGEMSEESSESMESEDSMDSENMEEFYDSMESSEYMESSESMEVSESSESTDF